MDIVILIGRIFFSLIFLAGAGGHLTSTTMMTEIARSKKVPAARLVVVGSGVMLAVSATMIIAGIWADLAALLLVIFLLATAVIMQNFWTETDPQIKVLVQMHFSKDLSLAGAALILMGFVIAMGDRVGLFLTDPFFG
jgi:putative oxidoreductase